jgi:hypothetical protein
VRNGSTLPLSIWLPEKGAFVARKPNVLLGGFLQFNNHWVPSVVESMSSILAPISLQLLYGELMRGITHCVIAYSISCTLIPKQGTGR